MSNRFNQIQAGTSEAQMLNAINKNFAELDNEAVTKTFRGPNGTNSIVQGRLPNKRYGQLYYDESGKARILIGQAPDDGRMGIWISAPGQDVLELLEP